MSREEAQALAANRTQAIRAARPQRCRWRSVQLARVDGLPFEWRRRLLQVRHAPEQIVSPLLRPAFVPASVTVETTGAEATLIRWQTSTLSLHRRALVETDIVCFVFALQLCGWPPHESHPPALQKMPDFIGAKVADLHRNLWYCHIQ